MFHITRDTWTVESFVSLTDKNPTIATYADEDVAFTAARKWVDTSTAADPWAIIRHAVHPERYRHISRNHGERQGSYYLFQDRAVTDVRTVEEFLARYYKPDRYTGRGEEYAAILLASHQEHCNRQGYDFISHHDSVTGRVVAFYPPHK